jgi:hypothetical protein
METLFQLLHVCVYVCISGLGGGGWVAGEEEYTHIFIIC